MSNKSVNLSVTNGRSKLMGEQTSDSISIPSIKSMIDLWSKLIRKPLSD